MFTIETMLKGAGLEEADRCPVWPPDVFAIAGALLKRSGAYMEVFVSRRHRGYLLDVEHIGNEWRKNIDANAHLTRAKLAKARPVEILNSWKELYRLRQRPIHEIGQSKVLAQHLLRLMLIADQASTGIGVNWDNGLDKEGRPIKSPFLALADNVKSASFLRTFGWQVSPDVVCVLGKQHTPQVGATFRSLTHYLSLYLPNDIKARWHGPYRQWKESQDSGSRLNLLLLPWPEKVDTTDFAEVSDSTMPAHLEWGDPDDHPRGYFRFQPQVTPSPDEFRARLRRALANARKHANQIDAVVFPEAALTFEQYLIAEQIAVEESVILIGGVRSDAGEDGRDVNLSIFQPVGAIHEVGKKGPESQSLVEQFRLVQPKHHRWCLNRDQLVTYQLTGQLSVSRNWWENIVLRSRELYFFALNRLTWSVLICEDLARQDPAADLIRAVGPNLLIALLMDGPQKKERWAARYASVLADDPGTSVLSITSLGMSERSRPFLRSTGQRADPSRVIALWRDQVNGEFEICLDKDENACVLSLECKRRKEYSADGRDDGKQSRYPVFAGFKSFKIE